MTDKEMEKIIKICMSKPNMEVKPPILIQGLNETDDEYRKRVREYMEQQDDR